MNFQLNYQKSISLLQHAYTPGLSENVQVQQLTGFQKKIYSFWLGNAAIN